MRARGVRVDVASRLLTVLEVSIKLTMATHNSQLYLDWLSSQAWWRPLTILLLTFCGCCLEVEERDASILKLAKMRFTCTCDAITLIN
jgi:hypothetical protein